VKIAKPADDINGVQTNESIRPDDQLKLTEEVPNYSYSNNLVIFNKYFCITYLYHNFKFIL